MKMNGMYYADWMDRAKEYEQSAETYRQDAREAVEGEKSQSF